MSTTVPITRATQLFRAFADTLRLRILHLLAAGELCAGDLVTVLGVPQPTASRHLAYLRRAGLVRARRIGQWRFYSLAPARGALHQTIVACVRERFVDVPEMKRDRQRVRALQREGSCCPAHEGRR